MQGSEKIWVRVNGGVCPDIDRFQRDKSDPSVIVFSEIKRCQLPHFTHFFFKKQKWESARGESFTSTGLFFTAQAEKYVF